MKSLRICFALIFLVLSACSHISERYTLTLAHLNDTHSHLDGSTVTLSIGDEPVSVKMGGFPRIRTVVNQMRDEDPELLLLHAGDAVQGTLYFTLFDGKPEFDFLNLIGLDAMTLGNHEFDRGVAAIPGWIGRSGFPWISSNIDFTGEPVVLPLVKPHIVKTVKGEKVAVIGVTTETAPQSTNGTGRALFRSAVESVRRQVDDLAGMGVNRIILLSHQGYEADRALAAQVSGVDLIIGGHSHTLLGDENRLRLIGLKPDGPYPEELRAPDGNRVLIVQAWKWGNVVGRLNVEFNKEGEVVAYDAAPVIPLGETFSRNGAAVAADSESYRRIAGCLDRSGIARIVAEDSEAAALLATYRAKTGEYRATEIAVARDNLTIGMNSGPGPLAAESMLTASPDANAAILNSGGIRRDISAGAISLGDLMEVMPFANSLVVVELSGAELKQALEDHMDFMISKNGLNQHNTPYVAGLRFCIEQSASRGGRVFSVRVKEAGGYEPLQDSRIYRIIVNSFVDGGGDGFSAIRNAKGVHADTGVTDSDAFRRYLKEIGTVSNVSEQRITPVTAECLQ